MDQCTQTWALSIDADERVSRRNWLAELKSILQRGDAADGYHLRRQMYFSRAIVCVSLAAWGSIGLCGFLNGRKENFPLLRCTKVSKSRVRSRDSRGALRHYSYASIEEYTAKCDHYTTLAAHGPLLKRGRRFSVLDHLRPGWEFCFKPHRVAGSVVGRAGRIYLCRVVRARGLVTRRQTAGPATARETRKIDKASV